jgi:hypothetical protein
VDPVQIATALERAIAVELPPALPRQRWFGDKGRAITGTRVRDCGAFGARAWLTLVDVSFAEGPTRRTRFRSCSTATSRLGL